MAGLILRDALLVSDGKETEGDLWVEHGRVAGIGRVGPTAGSVDRPLAGARVLPGLIDLQLNGLVGIGVYGADAVGLAAIAGAAPRMGCTSFLPTLVSAPLEAYPRLAAAMEEVPAGAAARVLGVHLEGPFLNPAHAGAHSRGALRRPSINEARSILDTFAGRVRLWTVAPELPGSGMVVEMLRERGVVVAAGHSGLGFEEARSWLRNGVSLVTHLFNAMPPLHHRQPGLAGAALLDGAARFSLIADGHHVHEAMVRLAHRLGGDRLVLVTDASAPAGAPDGDYMAAGRAVAMHDGKVRLPDETLAGSTLRAIDAVRNLGRFAGASLAEAAAAMTSRPADLLGLADLGRLGEGCHADFLILGPDGGLAETWVGGSLAFRAGETLRASG